MPVSGSSGFPGLGRGPTQCPTDREFSSIALHIPRLSACEKFPFIQELEATSQDRLTRQVITPSEATKAGVYITIDPEHIGGTGSEDGLGTTIA